MEIKKNLTTQNYNVGTISRIKYIVVHYTGNNGDTALANTDYFKSYRGASAHYFVDETSIYQSIEDKNTAWHCGANKYYHNECRNYNSIGVEMCSYINGRGKYAFRTKTVKNAVWLVRMLMEKYNIPIENVIRHYDVTHKDCPKPYVDNPVDWENFKNKLTKGSIIEKDSEDDEMVEKVKIFINGKQYEVNRILKEGKNYVCLSDMKQAGFDVGYNAAKKIPSLGISVAEDKMIIEGTDTVIHKILKNDENYVRLRDLESVLDIGYDSREKKVLIERKK